MDFQRVLILESFAAQFALNSPTAYVGFIFLILLSSLLPGILCYHALLTVLTIPRLLPPLEHLTVSSDLEQTGYYACIMCLYCFMGF